MNVTQRYLCPEEKCLRPVADYYQLAFVIPLSGTTIVLLEPEILVLRRRGVSLGSSLIHPRIAGVVNMGEPLNTSFPIQLGPDQSGFSDEVIMIRSMGFPKDSA